MAKPLKTIPIYLLCKYTNCKIYKHSETWYEVIFPFPFSPGKKVRMQQSISLQYIKNTNLHQRQSTFRVIVHFTFDSVSLMFFAALTAALMHMIITWNNLSTYIPSICQHTFHAPGNIHSMHLVVVWMPRHCASSVSLADGEDTDQSFVYWNPMDS